MNMLPGCQPEQPSRLTSTAALCKPHQPVVEVRDGSVLQRDLKLLNAGQNEWLQPAQHAGMLASLLHMASPALVRCSCCPGDKGML